METLYLKDCSQGPGHVHTNFVPIEIERLYINFKLAIYEALIR